MIWNDDEWRRFLFRKDEVTIPRVRVQKEIQKLRNWLTTVHFRSLWTFSFSVCQTMPRILARAGVRAARGEPWANEGEKDVCRHRLAAACPGTFCEPWHEIHIRHHVTILNCSDIIDMTWESLVSMAVLDGSLAFYFVTSTCFHLAPFYWLRSSRSLALKSNFLDLIVVDP